MYTASKLGDSVNKQLRRRIVTVRFSRPITYTDPETQEEKNEIEKFDVDFQFSLDAAIEDIRRTVKQYLDDINFVPPVIPDGEINLATTEVVEPVKTPAELAREQYHKDRARLAELMALVRDGVFTGNETQIASLQTKVRQSFKPEYLG